MGIYMCMFTNACMLNIYKAIGFYQIKMNIN